MKIYNHRDFWSGVMFIIFGVVFMILSNQYTMGTAAKMGPGYFPEVLGGIMTALGILIMIPAFRSKNGAVTKVDRFQARGNLFILVAVALFALALPKLGFVIAAILLIMVSAYGSVEFKLKETLISTVVLVLGCYLVFVKGLELQFPVWPPFLMK